MKKLLVLVSVLMSVVVAGDSVFDLPGESIKQFWIWALNIVEPKFELENQNPKILIEILTKTDSECFEILFRRVKDKENTSVDAKCADLNSNFLVVDKLPLATSNIKYAVSKKRVQKPAERDFKPEVKNVQNDADNNSVKVVIFKIGTLDVYVSIENGKNFLFYSKNSEVILQVMYGETEFGRIFVLINDIFYQKDTIPKDPPFVLLNKWNFDNLKFLEENTGNVENKATQNKIHTLAGYENILYHFNLKSLNSCSNQLRIIDSGLPKDKTRDSFVYVNPHPIKAFKCVIYALVEGPVWGVTETNFKDPASQIEFFKNVRKIEEFRTNRDGNVIYKRTEENGDLILNVSENSNLLGKAIDSKTSEVIDYDFKATFVLHEDKIDLSQSKAEKKDSARTSLQISLKNYFSSQTPFKILSKSFIEWMHKFLVSRDPSRKYVQPVGFSGFPKSEDLIFNKYYKDLSVTITIKMPTDDTISKEKNKDLNNHIQPDPEDIDYSKYYPEYNDFPELIFEERNSDYFSKVIRDIEKFGSFDPNFDLVKSQLEKLNQKFNDKKMIGDAPLEDNFEDNFGIIEGENPNIGKMNNFDTNMARRTKKPLFTFASRNSNKARENKSQGNANISQQEDNIAGDKKSKNDLILFDEDEDDYNINELIKKPKSQEVISQPLQNADQQVINHSSEKIEDDFNMVNGQVPKTNGNLEIVKTDSKLPDLGNGNPRAQRILIGEDDDEDDYNMEELVKINQKRKSQPANNHSSEEIEDDFGFVNGQYPITNGNSQIVRDRSKLPSFKGNKLKHQRILIGEDDDYNMSTINAKPEVVTSQPLENAGQSVNKAQQTNQTPNTQEPFTRATFKTTEPGKKPISDPPSKPMMASTNQANSSQQPTLKAGDNIKSVSQFRRGIII